ncbi:MAG TPA: ferric reductase-like transmembrane domain-containing protein [Propionibacteriaceae bacterium]|nr:ferric reductase-like transmembrane domain-containing protein [Propionibacteriaceae bacterium]
MSATSAVRRAPEPGRPTPAPPRPPRQGPLPTNRTPDPRPGTLNSTATMLRALRADLLTVIGWVSVAVAIALFLADHGLAGWGTLPGATLQLGILTGLVATDLMVLSLLLSSRIPFVDKAVGHDRALSRHGDLGQWVLYLVLAHGIVLLVSYALTDRVSLLTEFGLMWGIRNYVFAVISGGLLTLVAVSSIVMALRRRLPQEVWHVIHLTTYAAVILSIPHQFSLGLVVNHGFARSYWIAMYAVTAFCMIAFRFLLPLFTSIEHQLRVARVERLSPDAVAIIMTGKHLDRLDADGGQFFYWRFMTPRLWWHQHPFSLSTAPDGESLRVTVRVLGKGTRQLVDSLRPGDRVWFEGPYGLFSDAVRTSNAVVLAGAGAGIGPIVSILQDTDIVPGRALVLLRASTPSDLLHFHEVRNLCASRGVQLVTLVGRRSEESGWLPASAAGSRLVQWAPWLTNADVFVCGPDGWTDAVVAEARASGVPDKQVHFERFSW